MTPYVENMDRFEMVATNEAILIMIPGRFIDKGNGYAY
jgi:hypothetical protein